MRSKTSIKYTYKSLIRICVYLLHRKVLMQLVLRKYLLSIFPHRLCHDNFLLILMHWFIEILNFR